MKYLKVLRRLPEGSVYPSVWWGYCWSNYEYCRYAGYSATIAPIGLNVALALVRWCWLWIHHGATRTLSRHEPRRPSFS